MLKEIVLKAFLGHLFTSFMLVETRTIGPSMMVLLIQLITEIFNNNLFFMNSLIQRLTQANNWKETMRSACKLNHICTSFAGQLTPSKLGLLIERFTKAYETNPDSLLQSWIEHQMRAFQWILIAVSSEKSVSISEFGSEEWKTIFEIFHRKSENFLRYQTRRFLLQKTAKNKNWAPDQNQVMYEIMAKYQENKAPWNEVARSLFEQSEEKYFRTAKHCRQHWLNYLDPSKKRGDWTKQQDLQLLEKIQQEGKKWAKIGLQFNRTEHNVKNRFNSILSKQRKTTPNVKKEQKLIQAAKKSFQSLPQQQKEQKQEHPIRINLKTSSQSMYNENKNEPYLTFHEIEPKNPMDYLQNYSLQGGQYVKHLLKEEQDGKDKSEPTVYSNFWYQSPKNLTPMGFSPSPFSFSTNCNYYIHNFNMQIQRQNENDGTKK